MTVATELCPKPGASGKYLPEEEVDEDILLVISRHNFRRIQMRRCGERMNFESGRSGVLNVEVCER